MLPDWLSARLRALPEHPLTEAMFLRLLGFIYVVAFGSLYPQISGLLGSHGIAPAQRFLNAYRSEGFNAFLNLPTLFWFDASDRTLHAACVLGCLGGLVLISGRFTRTAALLCWVLYLSLATAGQPFLNFQWDALLLECGFLALFSGIPLTAFAYRFLLFRLMFESGLVKLTSHDPNWHNLHALRFHFLTQPLPNPIAYYAYRLPGALLDFMTGATLFIELVVPFFLFAPRKLRFIATAILAFLQVLILLTGNYAFFNLLTIALCFWSLDDRVFEPLAKFLSAHKTGVKHHGLQLAKSVIVSALILIGALQVVGAAIPSLAMPIERTIALVYPFDLVNNYGLFAIMTTARTELVLEGSDDSNNWREYEFRYKPGSLHRAPPIVAPYQPRLDWQMWFAALGNYDQNQWIGGLVYALLTGEPSVRNLLAPDPFGHPPHYLRIEAYDYQFSTLSDRSRTGAVWTRRPLGIWFGPVSLKQ